MMQDCEGIQTAPASCRVETTRYKKGTYRLTANVSWQGDGSPWFAKGAGSDCREQKRRFRNPMSLESN